jgi:predicted DNA-binding transcriptional regulator AlpA
MHHLMGVREVADLLGVTRQRAQQITRGADFPPPVAELKAGPVWESAEVERWRVRAGERRAGRPPSQPPA